LISKLQFIIAIRRRLSEVKGKNHQQTVTQTYFVAVMRIARKARAKGQSLPAEWTFCFSMKIDKMGRSGKFVIEKERCPPDTSARSVGFHRLMNKYMP
jgi:hypothetical protein